MGRLERGCHLTRILVTGAAGFLGRRLVRRLLDTDPGVSGVVLWDRVECPAPKADGVEFEPVVGDLSDDDARRRAIGAGVDAVFHLAAVVSSQAEQDFDLGLRVNIDGTRALLDACRQSGNRPKFLMASSVAVFGGDLPRRVPDAWAPKPRSSYGAEKAVCELLINEYSRRGFVDGCVLRVPTVVIRPGKPNRAASSFASSIFREPLNGERAVCPVAPETPVWLTSPAAAVDSFVHAYGLDAGNLGDERVISLPGLSVSVAEMVAALERQAGPEATALIDWQFDPGIAAIVQSWPGDFEATRALDLGFRADAGIDDIVRAFMAEREQPTENGNG